MVTSPARRTPSLFTSSSTSSTAEVAATVIAFLLLTSSIGQTSCSPAQFHQRNISTIIDHHEPRLPTSTHSAAAAAANDTLHHALLHRMVRQGSVTNTPTKIACYSCTYIEEDGYISGEECKDPFDKANNIPELMCPGWCHKLQKKLHQGGLMLVRGCSKTCEEKVDEHGYRHCCKSKQCNRSASLNSVNNSAFKIICSTLLCLFLAVRLNSFV